MEQGLNLGLQQKLVMTPQLRQAIQILQLSAQELSALIETEFLENPALEVDNERVENNESQAEYSFEDIHALAKYLDDGNDSGNAVVADGESNRFEAMATLKPTLLQVLEMQVDLGIRDPMQNKIAKYMIGCIDDSGYLSCSVAEVAAVFKVSEELVEVVLGIVQTFEPDGVGARNLQECLTIQAEQLGVYDGMIKLLLDGYLDDLAGQRYKHIAEKLACSPADVQAAAGLIRKLNPKPGLAFSAEQSEYIVPDVIVRNINGEFVVIINDYGVPRLSISKVYREAELDHDTKKYLEGRVNAATWLLKSIEQRRNTLSRVMTAIIAHQKEFFVGGYKFLRPLQMKTVAEELEIHESTVSRAVANKYAETPYGLVGLKSFFRANLGTSGEELIVTQIKDAIKTLIMNENGQNPLSDQQICELLKAKEMKISRRTVMKYREQMGFLSSMKRKKY